MNRSTLQKVRAAPASTKARILGAAEEVFATKGFAGASTRDIAGRAGVNISSLHYHWESKETLYFAVFQNIYEQILDLVRTSIPASSPKRQLDPVAVDDSMGRLFDFFADHPNVTKLLVRRLVESDDETAEIERDILLPAWQQFGAWMQSYGGRKRNENDSHLFMLTMHSVLLVFLLDSRQYTSLLGGSTRDPEVRERVRRYTLNLVRKLLT